MIRALGQDAGPATLGAHRCHLTNNVFRDRLCDSTRFQPTTDNRPQSGYRTIWNTTIFSLFKAHSRATTPEGIGCCGFSSLFLSQPRSAIQRGGPRPSPAL